MWCTHTHTQHNIDRLHELVDRLHERVDRLHERVDRLHEGVDRLHERVDRLHPRTGWAGKEGQLWQHNESLPTACMNRWQLA